MLDGLKRREENLERARRKTGVEKTAVIARALAAGIGIPETVSQIIYEMGVEEFLKLTEGFPALSRVDFK